MRALTLWTLCARLLSAAASLLPLEAEQLRASVGGFAVMNCHLDFPFGNEIPYHLQWDKDVSRLFFFFGSAPPLLLVSGLRLAPRETALAYTRHLRVDGVSHLEPRADATSRCGGLRLQLRTRLKVW